LHSSYLGIWIGFKICILYNLNGEFSLFRKIFQQYLGFERLNDFLEQCFPTFFGSWHPHLVMKIFGGTLTLFYRYKDQVILKIGGTLALAHGPCVPCAAAVGNHCFRV